MSNPQAITHLETAIRIDPQFSHAHYELASIYLDDNKLNKSLQSLQDAIESGKSIIRQLEHKRDSLLENNQFPEAKNYMIKTEKFHINVAQYLAELANLLFTLKKYKRALAHALESLDLQSEQSLAMIVLSKINYHKKRWPDAKKWAVKALDVDFINCDTHLLLATIEQKCGDHKEAEFHYKIAIDINPKIVSIPFDKLSNKYSEI
jgi:tetratricopeptide (TPR) repeat protein